MDIHDPGVEPLLRQMHNQVWAAELEAGGLEGQALAEAGLTRPVLLDLAVAAVAYYGLGPDPTLKSWLLQTLDLHTVLARRLGDEDVQVFLGLARRLAQGERRTRLEAQVPESCRAAWAALFARVG